ncbi:hypothetical protein ABZ820_33705 [Streptomyces diacarni]|uniref:hypothetical protein n=1 Tax=Streptomyces diacarni TaxID=2800381 RepID=UPI0034077836
MTSPPPAWRRKRAQKRREMSAQRSAAHRAELRRTEIARRGPQGGAEAEFDILRAVIKKAPLAEREAEWTAAADALRRLAEDVSARHSA